MSNETIEQKTCRLAIEVRPQILDYRNQITVATFYYKQVEKMIELAIACETLLQRIEEIERQAKDEVSE